MGEYGRAGYLGADLVSRPLGKRFICRSIFRSVELVGQAAMSPFHQWMEAILLIYEDPSWINQEVAGRLEFVALDDQWSSEDHDFRTSSPGFDGLFDC